MSKLRLVMCIHQGHWLEEQEVRHAGTQRNPTTGQANQGDTRTGFRALRLLEERSICLPASPMSVEKLAPDPAESRSMAKSAAACMRTMLS